MPTPSDELEIRRFAALVGQLRQELAAVGAVHCDLAKLTVEVEHWRRAARRAARYLGRPVRTGAAASGVWAALTDWPATETERARHRERRRAVEAAAQLHLDDQS
jgi:hypothetical protein